MECVAVITAASLCSGYGGLDLAVEAVFGAETLWCSEIDGPASRVLAERFSGVPNLGDLRGIVDPPSVDILTGGFPCQPVSTAGRREGVDDERWLFDEICGLLGRMGSRPRLCVFENVVGLLSANGGDAMARVVRGLAQVGYVGSWRVVAASTVGACHRRERVFIVARDADGAGLEGWDPGGRGDEWVLGSSGVGSVADAGGGDAERRGGRGGLAGAVGAERVERGGRDSSGGAVGDRGSVVADAYFAGGEARLDPGRVGERVRVQPVGPPTFVADSECGGRGPGAGLCADESGGFGRGRSCDAGGSVEWGSFAPAVDRWERIVGRCAPVPAVDRRLNPRFVEWMMGLPDGWVCDVLTRRTESLKVLGNGVVPQQAAYAIRSLV